MSTTSSLALPLIMMASSCTDGNLFSIESRKKNPLMPFRKTSTTKMATPESRFRQESMAFSAFEKQTTSPQL